MQQRDSNSWARRVMLWSIRIKIFWKLVFIRCKDCQYWNWLKAWYKNIHLLVNSDLNLEINYSRRKMNEQDLNILVSDQNLRQDEYWVPIWIVLLLCEKCSYFESRIDKIVEPERCTKKWLINDEYSHARYPCHVQYEVECHENGVSEWHSRVRHRFFHLWINPTENQVKLYWLFVKQ